MASLSLPRVLHPRKTSLEIEREVFEKSQAQALAKAISSVEAPVKQKHVRSTIIGTYQTQGAKLFWSIALRQRAMDDRIIAWKLCQVVHKVLREGHPMCLVESYRHKHDIDEIGKLWVHLKDYYGMMVRKYTTLLITKLEFHKRNPRFPGHLGVTDEELDSIGGNDINNYFQITVEMFDYLDSILDLQAAVFGSLNMSKSNSMTSAGQCRLAPLITCIQDASKLYDYCVKILFKLHGELPPDLLAGHRERFHKLFKQLKQFYQSTSNLQYFKDLIAIPPLPENQPNFLIMSDFGTYVTQEVVVPEPQEQDEDFLMEGNLIDTSDSTDGIEIQNTVSLSQTAHQDIINEREFLRDQCERLGVEVKKIVSENEQKLAALFNKISSLETELVKKDSELIQERQLKEDLLNHQTFAQTQEDKDKKVDFETYEKVLKWYEKVRDEHVIALRESGGLKKKLTATLKDFETTSQAKLDLENQLATLKARLEELEACEKLASERQIELTSLKNDKELFNMETEILKKSVTDACKERDSIKLEVLSLIQEKEELKKRSEELSYKLLDCENQLDNAKKDHNNKLKSIIRESLENSEEILKHAIHEVDNPALTALICSPDYLRSLTKDCLESLQSSLNLNYDDQASIIIIGQKIAHRLATFILQGRATCNTSPDINFGEKMAEVCKILGEMVLNVVRAIKNNDNVDTLVKESIQKLEEVASLAENINLSLIGEKAENLAEMLESEMMAMDKAIEEAAAKIQDMLNNSRAADSGIKLEVNEKILDTCTNLMQAIRVLVQKSKLLQAEIVGQGRGTASAKDFYKRNHQWTDGFISAAKAVAVAAKFLLSAADRAVTSNGKLEQLVVAAQEISASTAQLVVASRVKADRNSQNLHQLTQASKGVTGATGSIVATVKDCSQLIDETEELDVSNLTLHQAKRLEMDSRVRVLELEKELEQERYRLAALRRHHYQLAEET